MKRVIIYIITVLFSICAGATLMYAADVYLIKEKPEEPQDKNVIVTDEGISAGIENIYDAVVVIENYQKNKLTATGSGFIYTEDGYIMTNQHVIDKATDIRVLLSNGERITAKLIGGDKYADIAVLQIDKEKVKKVAKLGSSEKTKLGDTVFTIGSPMSSAYAGTVTRGILSGKNRLVEVAIEGKTNDWIMNVMQTDAAINPGNSGGPLCNVNGEVIGVNSLKITKSEIEGIGFAIPIEEALEYANDIKNGKKVEVAYLGIQMSNVVSNVYLAAYNIKLDSSIKSGVVVLDIYKDGPCYTANIQKGDVITHVNDQKITNIAQLRYYLYKNESEEEIVLKVQRKKEEKIFKIRLGVNK